MSAHIRTMADDLAAIARGESLGSETGTMLGPAVPLSPEPSALDRGRGRGILPVGLPARTRFGDGRRPITIVLLVLCGIGLIGGGLWAVRAFLLTGTGTVADAIPAEAIAFVSVQGAQGSAARDAGDRAFLDTVRSQLVLAVGGLSADRVSDALDVTYLLLPGSSPADPIPALLVRGMERVDLAQTPELSIKTIHGGLLITASTSLGRLDALRGTSWSAERALKALLRGTPKDAPILLGFRVAALESILKPLTVAYTPTTPLVLAVYPEGTGAEARVVGRARAAWTKDGVGPREEGLAGSLPLSALLVYQGEGSELAELFLRGKTKAPQNRFVGLEAMQRSLGQYQTVVDELLGLFVGPGAVGILPTATQGVRDVVAVLPVRSGSDPKALLRQLEGALREIGPVLAGASFPDAAFAEGAYRNVVVRYVNFGSSARSLDYAVVDDQVLFSTSRDSMSALIDAGRAESLTDGLSTARSPLSESPAFLPLERSVLGTPTWAFFRGDQNLRLELSPAFGLYLTLFQGLLLRPGATAGTLEGRLVLQSEFPDAVGNSEVPLPSQEPL